LLSGAVAPSAFGRRLRASAEDDEPGFTSIQDYLEFNPARFSTATKVCGAPVRGAASLGLLLHGLTNTNTFPMRAQLLEKANLLGLVAPAFGGTV
jgi:hypothetical protein